MEVNSPATHSPNSIGTSFPTEGFQVTITRKSQYMDQHIPMQILINGASDSPLKNGETRTYLITADQAEIQASLAMNKTAPYRLTVQAGSLQHLYVSSRMTNLIFILGTLLVVISAGLVLWTQDLIYMVIAAPAAVYHMYLRFIRKDKYLVIQKGTGH